MAPLLLAMLLLVGNSDQQQNTPPTTVSRPSTMAAADARLSAAEVDALVRRFEDEPVFWKQLERAREIVSHLDRRVLPRLERWLSSEDRHVRANAAFVFAGLDDPRGLEVIVSILNDRTARPEGQGTASWPWSVMKQVRADRYYAVHVLGKLGDRRALPFLVPLLGDSEVNYNVAWALGEIGDRTAVGPLIDALKDPDALVRTIAVRSLVKLKAKEALPQLHLLLDDHALPSAGERVTVAETAKAAITRLQREP